MIELLACGLAAGLAACAATVALSCVVCLPGRQHHRLRDRAAQLSCLARTGQWCVRIPGPPAEQFARSPSEQIPRQTEQVGSLACASSAGHVVACNNTAEGVTAGQLTRAD